MKRSMLCAILALAGLVGLGSLSVMYAKTPNQIVPAERTVEQVVSLQTATYGLTGEQARALRDFEEQVRASRARIAETESVLEHARGISRAAEFAALAETLERASAELRALADHAGRVESTLSDKSDAATTILMPGRLLPAY